MKLIASLRFSPSTLTLALSSRNLRPVMVQLFFSRVHQTLHPQPIVTCVCVQEPSDSSFDKQTYQPGLTKPAKIDDLEAGMPIASGNTLGASVGVQGLSEAEHSPRTLLDTNLPISSGADLRDEDSHVMVAGLRE